MKWRLNKIQYPVYNLGNGKRLGIWVQGCELHCDACVNESIWPFDGGQDVDVPNLFNWLLLKSEAFDGITITGGEPFRQYAQLIAFLHLIKTKTNLNVVCFSGFYLYELYDKFPDKLFAKYIDYLIDGRYILKHHENENTKGSLNQSVYRFEKGIPYIDNNVHFTTKWSVNVNESCNVYMSGIPKLGELEMLSAKLKKKGIEKVFK